MHSQTDAHNHYKHARLPRKTSVLHASGGLLADIGMKTDKKKSPDNS